MCCIYNVHVYMYINDDAFILMLLSMLTVHIHTMLHVQGLSIAVYILQLTMQVCRLATLM